MRAGMQCLLDIVGERAQPNAVTESEWLSALDIAEEENLLPWLAGRLSRVSAQLPDSVCLRVEEIRREAQQKAFAWSAALKHLLRAFQQRGIPVISLKGPWLAERLYRDAALRSYSDLDFLVRRSDWIEAEKLLRDLGFSPSGPTNVRHRHWRGGGIDIELHIRLEHPVDFHWGTEALWSRARLSDFHGVPGWLLAHSD